MEKTIGEKVRKGQDKIEVMNSAFLLIESGASDYLYATLIFILI